MSDLYIPGLPGVRSPKTAQFRTILRQGGYTYLAQGKLIDGVNARDYTNTGNLDVLQPGTLLGKITSSSLYGPSIMATLSQAAAAGATSLTVSAAGATELVRRVGTTGTFTLAGPPAASGVFQQETVTYSAVNTGTGVITCTATVNAYISGAFVQPTDGSQVILTFVPDGWGIKVTDTNSANLTVEFPLVPVSGVLVSTQLLPVWPTDTTLQNRIVSQLNAAAGGQFVFDHAY
jgi:hypothetical protein